MGISLQKREEAKQMVRENRNEAEDILAQYYDRLDSRDILRLGSIKYSHKEKDLRSAGIDKKYLDGLLSCLRRPLRVQG